jgi:hypothetical protein
MDTSKTHRPPSPDLTVSLEALYDHIPLGFILPEIPKQLFLLGLILAAV